MNCFFHTTEETKFPKGVDNTRFLEALEPVYTLRFASSPTPPDGVTRLINPQGSSIWNPAAITRRIDCGVSRVKSSLVEPG